MGGGTFAAGAAGLGALASGSAKANFGFADEGAAAGAGVVSVFCLAAATRCIANFSAASRCSFNFAAKASAATGGMRGVGLAGRGAADAGLAGRVAIGAAALGRGALAATGVLTAIGVGAGRCVMSRVGMALAGIFLGAIGAGFANGC
jgi:hypothetical protein